MKWIVAAFVFFALFIGTLVFISMRQDIGLVSKNYYQDELKHSEKMARQVNASHRVSTFLNIRVRGVESTASFG
jgi:hypothetical protein